MELSYLTRSAVKAAVLPHSSPKLENAFRSAEKSLGATVVSVFLSHSHLDADLIEGLITLLNGYGIKVYVDWKDGAMPLMTSPETAARIKEKIRENEKFIVVLTENSRDSAWVPWELGVADSMKGLDHIAIWPVADDGKSFAGIEFMGVYPTIETFGARLGMDGPLFRLCRFASWLEA